MRGFAFACCACAVVASAVGESDVHSDAFLASVSRRGMAPMPSGGESGEYARQTQSPMVWLNLRKSDFGSELLRRNVQHQKYLSQMQIGDIDA